MEQQSSYSDFIGVYKNAINPDLCDWLVDYMGKAHQVVTRNSLHVQDKQICLDAFSPGEAQALMDGVNGCLIYYTCLLYTSPSPRDKRQSRMPSSA